ncbi:MAG: hypothetical protein JO366_08750 [Methylobacteriaceae bacterium]|nr:hypothetical protein [Methylobacteriaceae bacterium]
MIQRSEFVVTTIGAVEHEINRCCPQMIWYASGQCLVQARFHHPHDPHRLVQSAPKRPHWKARDWCALQRKDRIIVGVVIRREPNIAADLPSGKLGMSEPKANPTIAEIWPRPFGVVEIRCGPPPSNIRKVRAALWLNENPSVSHEAKATRKSENFSGVHIWIEITPERAKLGNIRDRGERNEIANARIRLGSVGRDTPTVYGGDQMNIIADGYDC